MRPVDYLKWPVPSVFSIKMTKKVLKEVQPDANQDVMDSIERMIWSGSLKPQHLQVPAYINEKFYYDEVIFIEVELREKATADRVARLLQKAIPYPLALGFIYEKEFSFQIAEKTIKQSQKDKREVNQKEFHFSEWMDGDKLNEQQKNYLTNLSLDKVGGTNLKEYFDKLMCHIFDENRQLQLKLAALEKEAVTIRNKYAKEKNAAKKAELHNQARELAEQIKFIKSRINKS
jgi:hypothetical protein